jgi:hypothetical protein
VAVGDLEETTKSLANSNEVLETTGTTCMTVAADHEATMKSRSEELAAIAQAKKILSETSSGAVENLFVLPARSKCRHRLFLADSSGPL